MNQQLKIIKMNTARWYYWLPMCLFLLGSSTKSVAQYSIFHAPSGIDEWSYSDLMNCTIINGSTKSPLVYINCTVSSNQRVVLRAQSNVFRLTSGTNLLTRADVDNKLMPIKTIFLDAQIRAMMDRIASPIDGQYDVKLDLVEKTENTVLTYYQYYKTVKSISPFRLITPFDGSTVDNLNPTFTWTRPLSIGSSFDNQLYNIALQLGVHVFTNTKVVDVTFNNNQFTIATNQHQHRLQPLRLHPLQHPIRHRRQTGVFR